MTRPYVLSEVTFKTAGAMPYEVAVLPWGATEAHNYHLPYGTDSLQCDHIAAESARIAWEAGAKVLVLPTVPFGVNTGQADVPYCLNMNPSTQQALLADLIAALAPHGVRKLVVLNGHGGNDFKQMIRELQPRSPLLLCTVNWYQCIDPARFFDHQGDHAGELETSVMLCCFPELVLPLDVAGDGHERKPRIAALRERWAWMPRPWTRVTADTGIGSPHAATADKGNRYLTAVTGAIGQFLIDFAAADPAQLYE